MSQLSDNSLTESHQFTGLGLFFSLFRGQWRPGEFWNKRSFRRKFMLRSLLMPRLSREWMHELSQWSNLDTLLTRQPRLPVRLHRPYLAVNFSRHQVLDALRYHYTLLSAAMSSEELSTYLNTQALPLAQIEGKNGEIFTFELTMQVNLDKEGDSTILMRNSDGDVLAEMTFSILAYENKRTLFIGGLQGGKSDLPHEAIQGATKACHGLFPKRLVMEAVCRFAERLQVEQILAVSNDVHIFRGERYQDKNKKILSDYNSFWEAVGGECDKQGYFHIPLNIARKDESEIASKKRAEYRRRYLLLDTIQLQMADLFNL
ncbi:VirK/YbjX family protein [Kluyvera intermedia]|uniref:VirK/YbjX family protein n=1 Tax=Kluyvera intermedia TaxID=61648 RepID=UPI00242B6A7B|nr:VirK/YbjX family protein [Kluyvera intermedia]WEJ86135.1 MAG: VirK/YbjX family protein [Kluyvera intermedia]